MHICRPDIIAVLVGAIVANLRPAILIHAIHTQAVEYAPIITYTTLQGVLVTEVQPPVHTLTAHQVITTPSVG